MTTKDLNRRTVLLGAGAVAAGTTLAACGTSSTAGGTKNAAGTTSTSVAGEANAIGSLPAVTPSATDAGSGPRTLGPMADVKVGSGVIYANDKIVVTQPTAGEFKAFTAVCTHQGCILSSVSDGKINCNCHGSQYSIKDGSVLQGPAEQPLAPMTVQVAGGTIKLGG